MKGRLLSKLLAAAMAASCVLGTLPAPVIAAGSPPSVANMKVELLEHAYGVNTKDPAFFLLVDGAEAEDATENGDFLIVTLGAGRYELSVPKVGGDVSLELSGSGKYYVKDIAQAVFRYTAPDGTVSEAKELGVVTYSSDNSKWITRPF